MGLEKHFFAENLWTENFSLPVKKTSLVTTSHFFSDPADGKNLLLPPSSVLSALFVQLGSILA